MKAHPDAPAASAPIAGLSPREMEVLRLASAGLSNRRMADALGVSVHAVKFHLGSIYRKLRVCNRTEAAAAYLRSAAAPSSPEVTRN